MKKQRVMPAKKWIRSTGEFLAIGAGMSAASYLAYIGYTFLRYGDGRYTPNAEYGKSLLDGVMPTYEVAERCQIGIRAPAETTLTSACLIDLQRSAIVRLIFKARELLLGGKSDHGRQSLGLVDQAKAWGWAVLDEYPGREIVFGAMTQPWVASPTFRALPADEFITFGKPDYVKIAWNLAADPIGPDKSIARTETRVITTDAIARAKFRIYWAFFSPGIILIRRVALGLVKSEAERAARSVRA